MSTKLHDLPSVAVLAASVVPKVVTATETGSTVDLLQADGAGFAILSVGAIASGTTVGGKVQESADGSTWSDITGGAFDDIVAANGLTSVRFERAERYVRGIVTIAGSSPSAAVCAVVGSQKKTF